VSASAGKAVETGVFSRSRSMLAMAAGVARHELSHRSAGSRGSRRARPRRRASVKSTARPWTVRASP
jgi:hypothetical protein